MERQTRDYFRSTRSIVRAASSPAEKEQIQLSISRQPIRFIVAQDGERGQFVLRKFNVSRDKGYMQERLKSIFSPRKPSPSSDDYVEYHVQPVSILKREKHGNGLTFDTRDKARKYKKILKDSKSNMDAKIIRRELLGGYVMNEKEVW